MLTKKLDTKNWRFWRVADEAHKIIRKWPRWKRELKITKYSG